MNVTPRARADAAQLVLDTNRVEPCDIRFVPDLLHPQNQHLSRALAGRDGLVVTTPTVMELFGDRLTTLIATQNLRLEVRVIETQDPVGKGEHKTLGSVERVIALAKAADVSRNSVLIGFGGGVCTDIVGMAAGLIRRGIVHFRIPTTLIGQIDAGVGLKCGVNFGGKKNYLGLFNAGEQVLIDPGFLRTLPANFIQEGIAEMIKMAIICSKSLFEELEILAQHRRHMDGDALATHHYGAIFDAADLMVRQLQENPYERDTFQRLVDFGHCFSPRLESESGYSIRHGNAVAIDMALSVAISERIGLLSVRTRDRCIDLIQNAGLPIWHPLLTLSLCKAAMKDTEQHRGGLLNIPIPLDLGDARFIEQSRALPDADLQAALHLLSERDQMVPAR